MTIYAGPAYTHKHVSIGPPSAETLRCLPQGTDVSSEALYWFNAASSREDICCFGIYWRQLAVGQIFLRDVNPQTGESLVGYHLFAPQYRGRGIGTAALGLLQRFVAETSALSRLVIITSCDNAASQAIARKAGFAYAGTPRKDPATGMVFVWQVPDRP